MATVLTTMGRQIITGALHKVGSGPGLNEPLIIAWGTGAGTSSSFDRALFTEVIANEGATRVTGTGSQVTSVNTNDTYQVTGTRTAGQAETITNVGLLDLNTLPAQTTLSGNGGSITSGTTTMLVAGHAGFSDGQLIQIDSEVITLVSGSGTNTWTITRGQVGTTAASHTDTTVVNGVTGNLFIKSDSTGLALALNDSITYTIKITFT